MSAASASAAIIDLGFALDESGSVGSGNFTTTKNALAAAIDNIPTGGDNQYRIAVVTFDSSASTIITPTIVTAANKASLQTTIQGISYNGGGTSIHAAVNRLTDLFTGMDGGLGATTLFNIATDGASSASSLQSSVEAASDAGVDGISYEAIGSGAATGTLLSACYAGTYTASSSPSPSCSLVEDVNNLPNATQEGFVLKVGSFAGFADAIDKKVRQVVDDTGGGDGVIPLPAGLPLLLSALGLGGLVARRKRKAA
ncbi:hypothetical protein GCM10011315_15120 [Roseovarius pacificus]|nr:hypothetical protein GCM10011315_15120 [Roseovarius pacificus]